MQVKIKDYEKPQHELDIALRLAGLNVNYVTIDLLYRVLEGMIEKGDKFSVKDGVKIQLAHEEHWDKYRKNLKDEKA